MLWLPMWSRGGHASSAGLQVAPGASHLSKDPAEWLDFSWPRDCACASPAAFGSQSSACLYRISFGVAHL